MARTMPTIAPARAVVAALLACLFLAAFAPGRALAQSSTSRAVVEMGLGGHLVADAWNPLRVTVRDIGSSVLRLRIDEGSLLTGPRIVHYSATVPGGSGVTVFDDDVYVPAFRSLSWTLTNGPTVVASGSLGAADADTRPLEVLLSSQPGDWRAAYAADARLVDVAASDLPARVAAYDGVAGILVDGSAAAPRPDALAAAAAGGAQVLLVGALPASQAGLANLAENGPQRLGAGEVVQVAASVADVRAARSAWSGVDRTAITQALASEAGLQPPRQLGQPLVLSLAAGLVLLSWLALRFGRAPGLVAALVLAAVASLAGWRLLRPSEAVLAGSHGLLLSGGELALRLDVEERLTLPAGTVRVAGAGHPLVPGPYRVLDGATEIDLPRWHAVSVVQKPTLRPAPLVFVGNALLNLGSEDVTDVVVSGLGRQPDLAPGATQPLQRGEEGALPPLMERLVGLVPPGTALARTPSGVLVALRPPAAAGGGP